MCEREPAVQIPRDVRLKPPFEAYPIVALANASM